MELRWVLVNLESLEKALLFSGEMIIVEILGFNRKNVRVVIICVLYP